MGYDLHEGHAEIVSNGKRRFIDREGQLVISPIYKEITSFKNGVAQVKVGATYRPPMQLYKETKLKNS